MLPIAYGQAKLENEKQSVADKYLFYDTNLMVTKYFQSVLWYCEPLLDS
jgi:nicotinamide riboside kinase